MNYNAFLDGFFGNYWLCYGLLLVYVVLVFVFSKRLFGEKDKKRKLLSGFMYYAVPILWVITVGMINPVFWGYGKPVGITSIYAHGGKLYVQDYLMMMSGRISHGNPYSRIHIIDAKTGERLRRFTVGEGRSGSIVGVHGDTLIYANSDNVQFYSVADGSTLLTWSAETLPKLFPQLTSGVHNFSANRTGNFLQVNGMDGNNWMLDILHNSISKSDILPPPVSYDPGVLFLDNGRIRKESSDGYSRDYIDLDAKSGNSNQQVLCNGKDSVLNKDLVFLGGKIVAFSLTDSCFVVQHYETVAQKRVIFTGVSMDGKQKLWEIRQHDLRPGDDEDDRTVFSANTDATNHLFCVSLKNELFAFGLKDGKLVWREVP